MAQIKILSPPAGQWRCIGVDANGVQTWEEHPGLGVVPDPGVGRSAQASGDQPE